MGWNRYNLLRDVIVPFLLGLLRVLWIGPWLELARRGLAPSESRTIIPLSIMLGLYLASVILAREQVRVPSLAVARLGHTVAGFVAILLVLWWRFSPGPYSPWNVQWIRDLAVAVAQTQNEFSPVLLAVPVLIYLWLQGILDGQQTLYRDDVWNAFVVGFFGLVLVALVGGLDRRGLPAGMSNVVFAFFAVGMTALALASLETEQRMAARRGDGQIRVDRYWLASVASVVIVLLVIGLAFSALLTPHMIARTLWWTSIILELLGRVLYIVVLLIAYLSFYFLEPLIALVQRALRSDRPREQVRVPDFRTRWEELSTDATKIPPQILNILPWLGLAVVVLVVGLAFALALRRWQRQRDGDLDETRELILSAELVGQQLRDLLGRLRRRGRQPAASAASPFLSLDGEQPARRAIRALYQAFLALLANRGWARQPGQTPDEYRRALRGAIPTADSSVTCLTEAYVQARYGAQEPSTSVVHDAERAWKELGDLLQREAQESSVSVIESPGAPDARQPKDPGYHGPSS